ncbi:competence type IV pilus minor pilin ComGG [Neobacillus niacini]|uniref:competence type IV pilus minor pilin ComGG n=1 Tax=Neobacillus niacini TaxID=86668 RepID=UPI003983B4E8
MRKSERGFTYPLTLVVLILFLSIFSFRVEQLLSERKMFYETTVILQEEYYFHSSFKKIEKIIQTGGVIPVKGSFSFQKGNMAYQADNPIGSVQKVSFTLKLNSGETVTGRSYFDLAAKKMIKWNEIY